MKKYKKPLLHICANCWFYVGSGSNIGVCVNCDNPRYIRHKQPHDICDGGGLGADDFGFMPCERE